MLRAVVDDLSSAAIVLRRLCPRTALAAVSSGAVLFDIRCAAERAAEGQIPEAFVAERCASEWSLDRTSDTRLPEATGFDPQVIIVCSEGSASTLAAAPLQDLGLYRAMAVIGGFRAWRAAGLPIIDPA